MPSVLRLLTDLELDLHKSLQLFSADLDSTHQDLLDARKSLASLRKPSLLSGDTPSRMVDTMLKAMTSKERTRILSCGVR